MIRLWIPTPTINKIPKTKSGFKLKPNGKRADPTPRGAWLNSNQRLNEHERAKRAALWREAGLHAGKVYSVPRHGTLKRYFALATVNNPRDVDYDPQNWYPSVKPIIDGLVTDYGFLPDDNDRYLMGPLCIKGPKADDGFGGIGLRLFDLGDQQDRNRMLKALGES